MMGSNNYYGDGNHGNERSEFSSSSRKGKKNRSEKPKLPQRGLGVAQLEKLRLHSQLGMGSNYLPPIHNPFSQNFIQEDMRLQTSYTSSSSPSYGLPGSHGVTMGLQDSDRANIRHGESEPSSIASQAYRLPTNSWQPGNAYLENKHFLQPSMTRSFLDISVEGSANTKKKKDRNNSLGFCNQNSESSSSQEIDLELRL